MIEKVTKSNLPEGEFKSYLEELQSLVYHEFLLLGGCKIGVWEPTLPLEKLNVQGQRRPRIRPAGLRPHHVQLSDALPTCRLERWHLLPQNQWNLNLLALILREGIRFWNQEPSDEDDLVHLGRILRGQYIDRDETRQGYQLDHTQPSQELGDATQLMHELLTKEVLNHEYGLSLLLLFRGTGQTKEHSGTFFAYLAQKGFPKTAQKLIDYYKHYRAANKEGKMSNSNIFGQPARAFILGENAEKDFAHFEAYFSEDVMARWRVFCSLRDLPSWRETLDMLVDLKISPFKGHGNLATYHLACDLAVYGFCKSPTVIEVADWIHKNGGKGMWQGLRWLAFTLQPHDLRLTRIAFQLVHDHVLEHLSAAHQDLLRTNRAWMPMFIEHLLCKVARWIGRAGTQVSLFKLAYDMEQEYKKYSSTMAADRAPPFGCDVDWARLDRLLQEGNVLMPSSGEGERNIGEQAVDAEEDEISADLAVD